MKVRWLTTGGLVFAAAIAGWLLLSSPSGTSEAPSPPSSPALPGAGPKAGPAAGTKTGAEAVRKPAKRPPLPPGTARVQGRVTVRATGAAFPGATVRIGIAAPSGGGEPVTVEAISGPDGRFEIGSLPAWRLVAFTVAARGFVVYPDPLVEPVPPPAVLAPGSTVVRDAALRRGASVHGRVLSTRGRPVAGVEVTATPSSNLCPDSEDDLETLPVTSGPDGSYRIAGVWRGRVELWIRSPDWIGPKNTGSGDPLTPWPLQCAVVDVPPGGDVEKDLTVVATGTVEGTVLAPDGSPASGVTVSIETHHSVPTGSDLEVDDGAGGGRGGTSDARGRFLVTGVVPGPVLAAHVTGKGGAEGESPEFALEPGEHVRDVTIRMKPGAEVLLHVRDTDGNPVSGVRVRLAPSMNPGSLTRKDMDSAPRGVTDEGGSVRFAAIYPGVYQPFLVLASGAVYGGHDLHVAPGGGAPTEGTDTLPAAALLSGTVHLPDGSPACGTRVEAWHDRFGEKPPASDFLRQTTRVGKDGSFSLPFPSGPIAVLSFTGPGGEMGRVEASAPGHVNVTIRPRTTVTGRVVERGTNTPVPGVEVEVSSDKFPGKVTATTGPDGRFEIRKVPPGRRFLVVRETRDWQRRWVPDPPAGDPGFVVAIERTTFLAGKLLDEKGRAAPGMPLVFSCRRPGARQDIDGYERSCTTRWDGSFRVEGLATGSYTVRLDPEVDRYVPILARDLAAGRSDVVLHLVEGRRIEGRLVLASHPKEAAGSGGDPGDSGEGTHLSDVDVEVVDASTGEQIEVEHRDGPGFRTTLVDPARTYDIRADSGAWVYPGEPAADGPLVGSLSGVRPGTSGLVLTLRPLPSKISGTVFEPDGVTPVENGWVEAVAVDTPEGEAGSEVEGYLGEKGRFELPVRSDRNYRIRAGGTTDFAPVSTRAVTPGTSDLRLVLVPGHRITGRLLYPDGKPARVDHLHLVYPGGEDDVKVRPEDGAFSMGGLPAGPVHIFTGSANDDRPVRDLGVVRAPAKDVILTVKPDDR